MWFVVWLNYFQYQMSSIFCVAKLVYIHIELKLPPFMCCVALCIRISHWIDYVFILLNQQCCMCMFFLFCLVCCINCLSLSLPFWWINVFIILVGLYVLHVRLLTDWLFFCFIFLCTWFLCICVLSCVFRVFLPIWRITVFINAGLVCDVLVDIVSGASGSIQLLHHSSTESLGADRYWVHCLGLGGDYVAWWSPTGLRLTL